MVPVDKAFVIQIHSGHGPFHYDLMLACGGALATWRLSRSPAGWDGSGPILAEKLADHRLEYLTYAGPVSTGRGEVKPLDAGTYETIVADQQRWRIHLHGKCVQGTFELKRKEQAGNEWVLIRLP